jgi:glycosyltransferase involved in cell wall biosynthesis
MTVSLAMIVKNEEHTLPLSLGSIAHGVDEIVVVDTGSTDNTVAVAQQFGARIAHFTWCNDFAAARQFAFDQCTGDWIIWIDADDRIEGAEWIRDDLQNVPDNVDGVQWLYVRSRDQWGNSQLEFWRERCVRNNGSHIWKGRIHEVLVATRTVKLQKSQCVLVEHAPEPERSTEKQHRNLTIIEDEIAKTDDSPDPRMVFYLGNEYADAGRYDEAIAAYERYLVIGFWADEKYLAQIRIANLLRIQQKYEQAIDADLRALKIHPEWPHAYFNLAKSYYFLKDWPKCVHWSQLGQAMHPPDTLHFMNPMEWRYAWIIYWTNALYHIGAIQEAYEWTKRALEMCPGDQQHVYNLAYFRDTIRNHLTTHIELLPVGD